MSEIIKKGVDYNELKSFPLLLSLENKQLEEIAPLINVIKTFANEIIFNENEDLKVSSLYLIHTGEVHIIKMGLTIGKVKEKEFFGEMAVLAEGARSATVRTSKECILYEINKALFTKHLKSNARVIENVALVLENRLRVLNDTFIGQFYKLLKLTNELQNESIRSIQEPDKKPISIDIHNTIKYLIELTEILFNKENISVSLDLTASKYNVIGDSGKLQRAIMNILINAKEAIIKSNNKDTGILKISTQNEGNLLIIKIADNGCGVKEDDIKKIFDSSFSTKTGAGELGLGLFISKTIFEEHKGSVGVMAQKQGGTVFVIKIPLKT